MSAATSIAVPNAPRAAAGLALAAELTWQVLPAALLLLRPDLDVRWQPVSEWAVGPYGGWMVLAFLSSAVGLAALVVSLWSDARGRMGRIGLALLLLAAIGRFGVGVFRTDPMPFTADRGLTTTGLLHMICGLGAMLAIPVAALLLNASLADGSPRWAHARRLLLVTGVCPAACLVAFIVHLAVVVVPMGADAYGPGVPLGWPARLLFLGYSLWLLPLAHLARRPT